MRVTMATMTMPTTCEMCRFATTRSVCAAAMVLVVVQPATELKLVLGEGEELGVVTHQYMRYSYNSQSKIELSTLA